MKRIEKLMDRIDVPTKREAIHRAIEAAEMLCRLGRKKVYVQDDDGNMTEVYLSQLGGDSEE